MGINNRCCECKTLVVDIRLTNGRYCVQCRNNRNSRARNRKEELEKFNSPAWAANYSSGTSLLLDRNVIARADKASAELRRFVKGKQIPFNKLSNTGGEGISGTLTQTSMEGVVNLLFKRGMCLILCLCRETSECNCNGVQCCRH
jgi:hypothetical protein